MAIYTGGCFPESSRVRLEAGGSAALSELRAGDRVLALGAGGAPVFSEVLLFLDRDADASVAFYRLHTDAGVNISLTPSHLIHAAESRDLSPHQVAPVFARDVREGQYVYVARGETQGVQVARVTRVEVRTEPGYVAPLTKHGTIVVDDVIASCYARISSQTIAHASFAPVRMLRDLSQLLWEPVDVMTSSWRSWFSGSNQDGGVHWYASALERAADFIIPQSHWFQL